jgi:hypothetical protein
MRKENAFKRRISLNKKTVLLLRFNQRQNIFGGTVDSGPLKGCPPSTDAPCDFTSVKDLSCTCPTKVNCPVSNAAKTCPTQ